MPQCKPEAQGGRCRGAGQICWSGPYANKPGRLSRASPANKISHIRFIPLEGEAVLSHAGGRWQLHSSKTVGHSFYINFFDLHRPRPFARRAFKLRALSSAAPTILFKAMKHLKATVYRRNHPSKPGRDSGFAEGNGHINSFSRNPAGINRVGEMVREAMPPGFKHSCTANAAGVHHHVFKQTRRPPAHCAGRTPGHAVPARTRHLTGCAKTAPCSAVPGLMT